MTTPIIFMHALYVKCMCMVHEYMTLYCEDVQVCFGMYLCVYVCVPAMLMCMCEIDLADEKSFMF